MSAMQVGDLRGVVEAFERDGGAGLPYGVWHDVVPRASDADLCWLMRRPWCVAMSDPDLQSVLSCEVMARILERLPCAPAAASHAEPEPASGVCL